MSSTTPTIGLKRPEGSDPFLTEDFAANLDKIDQAFALRPPGGGSSGGGGGGTAGNGDAATLQGHPASYFAVAGQADAATLGGHPASYFYSPSTPDPNAGGGGGGGSTYTLPPSVVQAPGRSSPRVAFASMTLSFNNESAKQGVGIDFSSMGFSTTPTILLTGYIGSNWDVITNVQGQSATGASARMAFISGASHTGTGVLHWMAIGI